MKKFIPILLSVIALTSCQKEPDMNQLSSELLVYTSYDKDCQYSNYTTFYLPDSILVLDNRAYQPQYYTTDDPRAKIILDAFNDQMTSRGYKAVEDKSMADMGLQLSYIKNTNTFVYQEFPFWWYDFNYYWPSIYWDPAFANWFPYYPYTVAYSYTVGSLIAELIVLKDADHTSSRLPMAWTAYLSGVQTNNQLNTSRALSGIYQAFEQSPYISRGIYY